MWPRPPSILNCVWTQPPSRSNWLIFRRPMTNIMLLQSKQLRCTLRGAVMQRRVQRGRGVQPYTTKLIILYYCSLHQGKGYILDGFFRKFIRFENFRAWSKDNVFCHIKTKYSLQLINKNKKSNLEIYFEYNHLPIRNKILNSTKMNHLSFLFLVIWRLQ